MDKKKVVSLLKDKKQDKRTKFSMLLMALNQAPIKNLALTAYYNRTGYSEKNLSSIEYDVKKAFSIKPSDLTTFEKTKAKPVQEKREKSKGKAEEQAEDSIDEEVERGVKITNSDAETKDKLDIEKYNEQLKAIDTEKADYQEMVSLAYDVADHLNIELPNKKKSTVVAFLEEQKKSLANEA